MYYYYKIHRLVMGLMSLAACCCAAEMDAKV